jgi:tRNA pseudouridine synthase 10
VVAPRTRSLDLVALRSEVEARAVGRIEVGPFAWSDQATVSRIKEARATKRYRARISLDGETTPDRLREALAGLIGRIEQRTPRRVVHRRADLTRGRSLHRAAGRSIDARSAEIDFVADGGLYIKELVSGDGGRTRPSLSELLGLPARVVELDVMDVTSDEFPDHEVSVMDSREGVPYSRRDLP